MIRWLLYAVCVLLVTKGLHYEICLQVFTLKSLHLYLQGEGGKECDKDEFFVDLDNNLGNCFFLNSSNRWYAIHKVTGYDRTSTFKMCIKTISLKITDKKQTLNKKDETTTSCLRVRHTTNWATPLCFTWCTFVLLAECHRIMVRLL